MTLADLRLQVHPGDGLVAHLGGAIVVIPDASSQPAFVDELLAAAISACDTYGDLPGRQLIRKVAGLVTSAQPGEVGSFAVVASAEDGLALMLCGPMDLELNGPGDHHEVLRGRDVATWVDRVIRDPFDRLVLTRDAAMEPIIDPRTDLRAGFVSGSGATLAPATTAPSGRSPGPLSEPASPITPVEGRRADREAEPVGPMARPLDDERFVVTPPGPPEPVPESAAPKPDGNQSSFVSLLLSEPLPPEELQPLPIATGAPADSTPMHGAESGEEDPAEGLVEGILCSRNHFNDPKARFCGVCGIGMVQQTHYLTAGPRPSLGVLVLDDGASFVVDRNYVIGREPETSELVRAGEAQPLRIDDPERRLSRVHARVLLENWEVRIEDAGSANGTRILRPDSSEWTPLAPEDPTTITSGTRIGLGDRELVFDSHFRAQ